MTVNILTTKHLEEFSRNFAKAANELKIVTPFLSLSSITKMIKLIPRDTHITLITRYNGDDFVSGVNSLEALELLLKRGDTIYPVRNLHTKLYIFNSKTAVWGSANLTMGGQSNNVELSTLINDEQETMDELDSYFEYLESQAKVNVITLEKVLKDKAEVQRVRQSRKNQGVDSITTNGVSVGVTIKNQATDDLDLVQASFENQQVVQIDDEEQLRSAWTRALNSRNKSGDLLIPMAPDFEHYVEATVRKNIVKYYYWQDTGQEDLQSIRIQNRDSNGNLEGVPKMFTLRLLKKYLAIRNWQLDDLLDEKEIYRVWKATNMETAWPAKEYLYNKVIAPVFMNEIKSN